MNFTPFISINKWQFVSGIFCLLISFGSFSQQKEYLKLDDVLRSVSRCYPQIKIAHLDINKTQGEYLSALGKFDPSLNLNSGSQPVGGYINNYGNSEISIPTFYNGVRLFGGYRNGQGDWPIYYQNYLTNSDGEYRAGLSLPILRDRLIDKDRADLLTKKEEIYMKQQDAAVTKIKVYQEAIKVYWQWVQAGFQVKTFRELLMLAKKRQQAIVKQANQGDLPNLAITENLQQIVQREQLLNQGKMLFEQAAINLSLYYRNQNGQSIVPFDSKLPPLVTAPLAHSTEGMSKLQQHPALKKLQNYSNIVKLKENLAKNGLLPNLDATAYTSKQSGTGGYPSLIPQAAMVGVTFKFPIFQREAKGRLITARSELLQITTEKNFLFDRLKNELTNLYIGIKIYSQQVGLLKQELSLAKALQFGETQKFYEGDSTLFLVNQREQTTAQVRLNWINARVKFEEMKDLIRFFSATT